MTKQAVAVWVCLLLGATATAAPEPPTNRRWAVVIGVQEYNDGLFRRLEYSTHDAKLMYRLLTTRCQFPAEQVALMVDEATDKRMLPFQRQIMAEVTRVAALAQQTDTVLIYFSGHGVPNGAGGVVLASRDCDKKQPMQTGIPVAWLREVLEKCPARQKLLVLDCCHAGAGRGTTDTMRLAPCFDQAQGLVTIASCGPDELSREWPRVEQGLFTHFLRCGLEGAADLDNNGVVDVEELYKYVYNQVSATALKELNTGQHPQIYRAADSSGVIALARLDRPDAPYPIRRKLGEVYQREVGYTEKFLIQRSGHAPLEAEYSETQLQEVEVKQVDRSSRPTHLDLHCLVHKKKTQGQLPGRTRFCQIRGPLEGKTIAQEMRPEAPSPTWLMIPRRASYPTYRIRCCWRSASSRTRRSRTGKRRPIQAGCCRCSKASFPRPGSAPTPRRVLHSTAPWREGTYWSSRDR